MRTTEMLWFEDISALNEPVLFFPVIGRISMKQFAILGVSGFATYSIFSGTHSPASAVPFCAGALLSLLRPAVGTPEWMAYSSLRFFACVLLTGLPNIFQKCFSKRQAVPRDNSSHVKKSRRGPGKSVVVIPVGTGKELAVYPDGCGIPVYCSSVEIRAEHVLP